MSVLRGLAAFLAGAVVALLIYGTGSHHVSTFTEPTDAEAGQAQQPSPDSEPTDGAVVTPVRSVHDTNETAGADRSNASFGEENLTTPKHPIDEDAARRWARESAVRNVRDAYSFLFEDLGLNARENDELFSLLVDVSMASMWIHQHGRTVQRGKAMDEDERSSKIAAIIGYPKLQQFLVLERNLASYRETRRIESMLEQKGAPLTEVQRDRLFDILAATRDRDYAPMPSGHIERYSLEQLERTLTRMNERERHVIQLAPSVLSPRQIAYLHERYQHCSYERADDLEQQNQQRGDHPNEPRPVSYRPCGP